MAVKSASKLPPRPERSAWIRVVDRLDFPEIDVRVDLHTHAVTQIRRVLEAVTGRTA